MEHALRSRQRRVGLGFLATAVLASGVVLADEWYVDSSVGVGYEHHDNISLTTAPHESVSGFSVNPRLDVGLRSDTWDARVNLSDNSARFNEERFDRDNVYAKLFTNLRNERNVWQLNVSTADESVITSDVIDPDTGLAQGHRDRSTRTINPAWTYGISERSQIRVDLQTTDVRYEDGVSAGLSDYDQESGTLQLQYRLSVRSLIFASASRLNFDAFDTRTQSANKTYQLGGNHNFSPTLSGSLSVGKRTTSVDRYVLVCEVPFGPFCLQFGQMLVSTTEDGSTYDATIQKRFELTQLALSASRAVTASGAGTLVETDSVSVRLERPIQAERLTAFLTVEAFQQKAVGGDATRVDRDYYRAEPRMRWRMARDWSVDTTYRYARQKYDNQSDTATNNSVFVTLTYTWPTLRVAR